MVDNDSLCVIQVVIQVFLDSPGISAVWEPGRRMDGTSVWAFSSRANLGMTFRLISASGKVKRRSSHSEEAFMIGIVRAMIEEFGTARVGDVVVEPLEATVERFRVNALSVGGPGGAVCGRLMPLCDLDEDSARAAMLLAVASLRRPDGIADCQHPLLALPWGMVNAAVLAGMCEAAWSEWGAWRSNVMRSFATAVSGEQFATWVTHKVVWCQRVGYKGTGPARPAGRGRAERAVAWVTPSMAWYMVKAAAPKAMLSSGDGLEFIEVVRGAIGTATLGGAGEVEKALAAMRARYDYKVHHGEEGGAS